MLRRTFPFFVMAFLALAAPAAAQDEGWDDDPWGSSGGGESGGGATLPVEIHGFVEFAGASRAVENPWQNDDYVLGEGRFRLELQHFGDQVSASFKGDVVGDAVAQSTDIDFREGLISFTPAKWLDVRAGRQVLTWGTGDFVFLNDLFPKDWVSFFSGRDDEFLKAPSNSVKLSAFSDYVNLDVVFTPVFEPDRFFDGSRITFFNRGTGGYFSESMPFAKADPPREAQNGEWAARLYKTIEGYEVALYGYLGYGKRPTAFDPVLLVPTYSRLAVYGASVRGNFAGGVANIEAAYHHSFDDEDGNNPFIPNSELRGLVGYDRELFANFQLGLQYYVEWMQEYASLIAASPTPQFEQKEARHMLTARITWRFLRDNLIFSTVAFVSPNEKDLYLRPSLTYRFNDQIKLAVGGNVLSGDDDHTFFTQLEENSNVYLRARYSF